MIRKKFLIFCLVFLASFFSEISTYALEGELKRDPGVNPHDHINDEGEILYYKCIICHKDVPDVKKAKSIDDVNFRFDDSLQPCYSCHPQPMHPGGSWMGRSRPEQKWTGAPKHWPVFPREDIYQSLKKSEKRYKIILPLSSGERTMCATCHNPHEKGLLSGKADIGADYKTRFRTKGMMICLYCHDKG